MVRYGPFRASLGRDVMQDFWLSVLSPVAASAITLLVLTPFIQHVLKPFLQLPASLANVSAELSALKASVKSLSARVHVIERLVTLPAGTAGMGKRSRGIRNGRGQGVEHQSGVQPKNGKVKA